MAALPVAKLGALLLKTLAKPVANRIKKSAAEHPKFRTFCISFGRFIQNTITRINIANLGHKTKELKEIPEAQAVARGAEFIGEMFVYSVGGGIIVWEYRRASEKAKRQKRKKQQQRAVKEKHLEEHVLELLERLDKVEAKLGIITPKMEPNVSKVTLTRDVLPQPPEEEEENNE